MHRTSFYPHSVKPSNGYEKINTFPSVHLQAQVPNIQERGQTSKPSLFLALAKAFGLSFAVAGFLKFISDLLNFVGPQVLKSVTILTYSISMIRHRWLIEYTKDENEPEWKGYFYAVLLFVSAIVQSLVLQHYFHRCFVVGMNLRTSIISIIYNKVIMWFLWEGCKGYLIEPLYFSET